MIRVKRCRFSAIFALIISLLIMAANFNSVVAPPGANPGKKWDKGWNNDWNNGWNKNEYYGQSGSSGGSSAQNSTQSGGRKLVINQEQDGLSILSPNLDSTNLALGIPIVDSIVNGSSTIQRG
ncbi:uncharacterized protein LOC129793700 [Lutzomyia longipalpis]|uniref:uncharacterized protein LOC129793700 n=1 Tax=Lutzomyia longipalpis TaxID=7200 RepID=UPI0024843D27|nr:uncharacterized protein LOC129793700 [Lutzomyia longipalpis]